MREIKVVIGKNFGDEGKGAIVNLLCRNQKALVVRGNGGAQAGHTVEEGSFRFVFHQLGSGSLQGCPVFWSKYFLPDLYKLGEEAEQFGAEKARLEEAEERTWDKTLPIIYADPECVCVTIYDVLLNNMVEYLRGESRHGSCGMGIFETVCRSKQTEYALCLGDFADCDESQIAERLKKIRDGYVKPRIKTLLADAHGGKSAIEVMSPQYDSELGNWIELMEDDNIPWNAARIMCDNFKKFVRLADWQKLSTQYGRIVFENAQGLMLDWDNEEYSPHLTASYTGLRNVSEMLKQTEQMAFSTLELCYVTRTYVTRHGAGRLDHECAREEINPALYDLTNVYNPWQGNLRYGKHPSGENFFRYIRQDMKWLEEIAAAPQTTLYLTHLDETDGKVLFDDEEMSVEKFDALCQEYGIRLQIFKERFF